MGKIIQELKNYTARQQVFSSQFKAHVYYSRSNLPTATTKMSAVRHTEAKSAVLQTNYLGGIELSDILTITILKTYRVHPKM